MTVATTSLDDESEERGKSRDFAHGVAFCRTRVEAIFGLCVGQRNFAESDWTNVPCEAQVIFHTGKIRENRRRKISRQRWKNPRKSRQLIWGRVAKRLLRASKKETERRTRVEPADAKRACVEWNIKVFRRRTGTRVFASNRATGYLVSYDGAEMKKPFPPRFNPTTMLGEIMSQK